MVTILRMAVPALAALWAVAASAQTGSAPQAPLPSAPAAPAQVAPAQMAPAQVAPAPASPPPAAQVQEAPAPAKAPEAGPGAPSPAAPPAAPAAQAPAAPVPAPPPVPAGTPATVLDTKDYDGVLGKPVRSAAGEDMGRIIDIIVDKDGRPRAAIIDFGGFLGVGSRKIAVDWRALHFAADNKPGRAVLQLTRNQVRVSPEYKPGDPIVVLGPASPAPDPDQAAARNPPEK